MTQAEKAQAFRVLHQKGNPLVLYNIWDAGSAKAITQAGAEALATGSWSVADAQGYDDGEEIPLDQLIFVTRRIVAVSDLPISVDMEGGYATTPDEVRENVRKIYLTGAIGMNFEDRVVQGAGLHPVDLQTRRIAAIREIDADFFINARTDLFLESQPADHASLVPEAIARGAAYAKAGADGFFVPGLKDADLIAKICQSVDLPINILNTPDMLSRTKLADLGVARISHGPYPYRNAMTALAQRYAGDIV